LVVKTNNSPFRILILGHGEMGRAMEYLLRQRHRITLWERHPKPDAPPVALDSVAAEQDFILFCLPATPHFELASRLRSRLRHDSVCLSVAKGLDEHGRTAALALEGALGPAAAFGVLYGPMISEEIRDGRPAFAQAGTKHADTYGRVRELFDGTSLYLEHSTDIAGISWSAVLKNVYAILFGVADEIGMGDNTRGYLAVAAVDELERLVAGLGGLPESPRQLAGLGDLITTATSAGSHHREVGRRLARGQEAPTGEGVHTLEMVHAHGLFDTRGYPLFDLIGRMLAEPATARAQMQNFLNRLRL
jgi:glycerol-3-phosphate dehydrogenase (NAD(P)+)